MAPLPVRKYIFLLDLMRWSASGWVGFWVKGLYYPTGKLSEPAHSEESLSQDWQELATYLGKWYSQTDRRYLTGGWSWASLLSCLSPGLYNGNDNHYLSWLLQHSTRYQTWRIYKYKRLQFCICVVEMRISVVWHVVPPARSLSQAWYMAGVGQMLNG